ncbi:MAG: DNA-directed RNA polymerase subunit alpha C-terminal domain-containing protein [Planctomycetota bacterium]|jgi:DNA-directed RNA polymerase subunit alpha|nr:DNA-directed RNA polymerase subunit alpha C-terminal domain-containing protein [Planctomycetota bacterium]
MTSLISPATEAPQTAFELSSADFPSFASLQATRHEVFARRQDRDALLRQTEALQSVGEEGRRRGLGLWMLGRFDEAADSLATYEGDDVASFTRAQALMSAGRPAEARPIFERLSTSYPAEPRPRAGLLESAFEADILSAGEETASANLKEALAQSPDDFTASADGQYLAGRAAAASQDAGQRQAALDHYLAAREADPTHRRLLFHLARHAEQNGVDDLALECYQALLKFRPIDKSVLMNLGVLYEDMGRDQEAATCYDLVARTYPTDRRVRMYLADAVAGMDMYYDEEQERKEDRLNQILRIPITDFELSVRARNCLNKMSILTLGDLVTKTETELLSYKNFGETSLNEIKEILGSKALRLGMDREEAVDSISQVGDAPPAPSGATEVENTPLAELNLSIRARRAVESMGCLTAGDIARRHEEEFTTQPNFGTTSLQELRQKLSDLGLSLKTRS